MELRTIMGLILIWGIIFYFSPTEEAQSHEPKGGNAVIAWIEEYHKDCCGERDCFPYQARTIKIYSERMEGRRDK